MGGRKYRTLYKTIIFAFFFVISVNLSAQDESTQSDTTYSGHTVSSDWNDHGLCLGLDFFKYLYGEIDYFHSYVFEAGGFPIMSTTMSYGVEFSYLDELILAPKIQGRVHMYIFNTSLTALSRIIHGISFV